MGSAWEEYKKKLGNTRPWDLLNPATEYAQASIAEKRFSICKGCPKLIKATSQCSECLCFMNLKTKILNAECPLHKW